MVGVIGAVPKDTWRLEDAAGVSEVDVVNLSSLNVGWLAVELVETKALQKCGQSIVRCFPEADVEVTSYECRP